MKLRETAMNSLSVLPHRLGNRDVQPDLGTRHLADPEVQHFNRDRKCHREVDVSFRDVLAQSFRESGHGSRLEIAFREWAN
jgi:hypothetical protein